MTKRIIEAGRTERHYWADIWHYRELFYVLAWRDISVRYKQTAIGAIWALIQPLATMAIFTVIFGRLAKLPSLGIPYPLLVLAGMLPWMFFSSALSGSSQSVVANANLISKVYFPRLIVPMGTVVTALVDFAISFVLLIVLMVWFHFWPTWRLLLLPVLICVAFFAALGPGLLITALNVQYRDFRYIIPFVIQFGLYISPVGFSSAVVSPNWRLLYSVNPMVGVIDGFRWAILGHGTRIYLPGFAVSLFVVAAMLVLGVWYFRRMERSFADII